MIYFSKDYGLDILIKSMIMVMLMILIACTANIFDKSTTPVLKNRACYDGDI